MAKKTYPKRNKKKLTDSELLSIIGRRKENGVSGSSESLRHRRENLLARYMGELYGDERPGQSQVVTRQCFEAVEWTLPSLLRIFLSSPTIAEFDPVDGDDEAQAAQETFAVNKVLRQNDGFMTIMSWIKDTLMNPNAYIKVYWEEKETTETEEYTGLLPPEAEELLNQEGVEPLEYDVQSLIVPIPGVNPGVQVQPQLSSPPPAPGAMPPGAGPPGPPIGPPVGPPIGPPVGPPVGPPIGPPVGPPVGPPMPQVPPAPPLPLPASDFKIEIYDLTIRRTTTVGRVVVELVPPEDITTDGKLTTISLENADYINHNSRPTRSDLIEMGFDEDLVYSLPAYSEGQATEKIRRKNSVEGPSVWPVEETNDPASEEVEVDETYLKVDYDQDGIAEFRRVLSSGDEILENEPCAMNPFVSMTAIPIPHSSTGFAWQEVVQDLQAVYTTLTRQLLNNAYRTNNPRTIVGRGVELADVLADIPNHPIRADNISDIRTEPVQPIIGQLIPTFEVLNEMKETRTGVSKSTMGLDADTLARVANGAFHSSMEQANQRIEALARILAESGIKPLMLKIHELKRTHQDTEYQVKKGAEWLRVNPVDWQKRDDMTVTVGLGTGNKQAQMLAVERVIATQDQLKATKSRLVTEQNQYNARAKLVEIAGLHSAEKYFTDPSTLGPAPPAPPEPAIEVQREYNQVEREKAQLKAREGQMKLQQKAASDREKLEAKIYELQAKLQDNKRKYELKGREIRNDEYKIMLDSELEQAKIDLANLKDLENTQTAYRGEIYG